MSRGGIIIAKPAIYNKHDSTVPLEVRLWSQVDKNGPIHPIHGQCWLWIGYTSDGLRGLIGGWKGRKQKRVTRVLWEMNHGDIPEGMWVLHKCDNQQCVNPNHHFLGTPQDNVDDKIAKGR
jgi:hypothetical protein